MDDRTIFGVLGNLTAFITFLLPARSLIQIRRGRIGRSPDLFSSVSYQYHAAIINCTLWVLYGDDFLKAINTVGFFMEFFYLTLFILFTRGFIQWLKHSGIVIVELICVYHLALMQYVKQQRQRKIAKEMRQHHIAEEMARSESNLSDFSKLDSIV